VRLRNFLRRASLLFFCATALAQPKPNAVTCATCHQAQAGTQPDTQMGRAAELPANNTTLKTHPKMSFKSGDYTYTVETRDGHSVYTVSDGSKSIAIPILWALGSQSQTWVLERNGKLFESQVSYYPSIDGLSITTGDDVWKPKNLEEAIGRPIGDEEAKSCFSCHATNAVADHKLNLATAQPGLTCEHCHLGASAHLAGVLKGDMSSVPPKLGKLSSEDLSSFCGQCHRTWETVVRNRWRGESDVRFQPYRLANSSCFNGTDPRIKCVACHDPHQKLVRDSPAYYDPKCLSCHAPVQATTASSDPHGKVCPVSTSNCVSCHMPKVPLPNGLMHFSDHEIRVVKAGQPYPN
jgi:Cytochrome c554 and c-prime